MSQIDAVKHILHISESAEASRYIHENRHCFVWEDLEECLDQWNRIAAVPFGLEPVAAVWGEDGGLSLARHGINTPVRLYWNATDALLVIHALSILVKEESEFRYCVDSCPGKQRVFMALPPQTWASLDAAEQVATRFASVPDDCNQFIREMVKKRPFIPPSGSNPPGKPWWQFW